MRKIDGSDYKECVVKTIWNTSAKLLQEKYYNKYSRSFDPLKDIIFQSARNARDTKRKLLQGNAHKRKISSVPLTYEHQAICTQWDEDTPTGLQKKFFQIAAVELSWRGSEAANCLLESNIIQFF
ncbi:unnamed protein product [Psylliodes chrysocephalus]|uniref:Uncharacterized protein n=1 Tax=Psylliodes chrysocephalus TaxID=3402493 RepID=A0A9P0CE33_9CUCU|nr:unnamed protein product [Psylliodes chrysocephala]